MFNTYTSAGRRHSALSVESRRLSMAETKSRPESLESRRLHAPEMPSRAFGGQREDVRELFKSKVRMFESMSQGTAPGPAKLKPDVSVHQLELKDMKNKEQILRSRVEILTADGVKLKELNERNQAEIKQLKATVRALRESEDSLKQQHVGITYELSHHESLTERQNQQNKDLKTAVQDLQRLLDEAEQQIFDKDELITKQDREIEFSRQLVEELNAKRTDMNQSICDLKEQLETRQEEEVLAGVENFSRHCSLLAEKCENLTAERDQLLSVREKRNTEIERLRVALQSLQIKEKFLNEDVHNLTAEGVRLKELNETNQAEIKQLKATVRALKESEDSLKQQHVGITNKLTERQIQQDKDLKTAVQDLPISRLNVTEQQIFDKDGCRRRQEEEEEVLAGVEDFRLQCSLLAEKCDSLTAERDQLKCLREEHHAEVEQLRVALQSLQDKEKFLNDDVNSLTAEGVRCESLIQKNQAEIKQLKRTAQTVTEHRLVAVQQLETLMDKKQREIERLSEALQSLQDKELILNEQVENLTAEGVRYESLIQKNQAEIRRLKRTAQTETEHHLAEVEQLESLIDEKQREIERLRVALQSLQTKAKFLSEDVNSLTADGVQLKELNETNQAEIKQLKATVRALRESEDSLKQQHVGITYELSHHESLTERQNQQNKDLKTAVQDLQRLLDEAEQQIFDKDELITKQDREIEFSRQLVEELNAKRTDMNQSICDLKEQLETRQEEEVLAGVENFSRHCSLLAEKCENLTAERDQLLSVRGERNTEIEQLKVLIETRGREIENNQQLVEELYVRRTEMNQSICDLQHQLEVRQEQKVSPEPDSPEKLRDDDLLESPPAGRRAPEVQTSSFWCRCVKRLLIIGVGVVLTTAGALLSGNSLAYNIFMDSQHAYCNLEPGVPCPV